MASHCVLSTIPEAIKIYQQSTSRTAVNPRYALSVSLTYVPIRTLIPARNLNRLDLRLVSLSTMIHHMPRKMCRIEIATTIACASRGSTLHTTPIVISYSNLRERMDADVPYASHPVSSQISSSWSLFRKTRRPHLTPVALASVSEAALSQVL